MKTVALFSSKNKTKKLTESMWLSTWGDRQGWSCAWRAEAYAVWRDSLSKQTMTLRTKGRLPVTLPSLKTCFGEKTGAQENLLLWVNQPNQQGRKEGKFLSHVQLFATPWTIKSIEFSRPEYWNGQPFPSPGNLPSPGIEFRSPTLQVDSLPTELQRKCIKSGVH